MVRFHESFPEGLGDNRLGIPPDVGTPAYSAVFVLKEERFPSPFWIRAWDSVPLIAVGLENCILSVLSYKLSHRDRSVGDVFGRSAHVGGC